MANILMAIACVITAALPDPPGWFGESLFGVKILPWPVANTMFMALAFYLIVTAQF